MCFIVLLLYCAILLFFERYFYHCVSKRQTDFTRQSRSKQVTWGNTWSTQWLVKYTIVIVFWINPRGLPTHLWKINKRKWMEVQTSPSSPSRPQMKPDVHAWKNRLWSVHNVQNYGYHRKNCLIWYSYYIIISPSSPHLIYNSHFNQYFWNVSLQTLVISFTRPATFSNLVSSIYDTISEQ